jgi:hypothetical protein
MTIDQFAQFIYSTQVSTALREISWMVPMLQSVHIIGIATLIGASLVMDLRLAGVLAVDEAPQIVVRRHLPWMWAGLGVLLLSGLTLGLAEPDRVMTNSLFWIKMGLVLTGFFLTLLFRYPMLKPDFQGENVRLAALVKPMAWLSLAIWVAVVCYGRWIAYN